MVYIYTSTHIHYPPALAKRLLTNQIRAIAARWNSPHFTLIGITAGDRSGFPHSIVGRQERRSELWRQQQGSTRGLFYAPGNTLIVFFLTARRHSKTGDFCKRKRLRAVVTTPTSDRRRPIPLTPSEASEYKLKLQGIDRRAPPGERPRGFIWLNTGNLTRPDTEVTDRLIALSPFCGQRCMTVLCLTERFVRLIPIIIDK